MKVQLKDPLEATDSLAGVGSEAAHRAGVCWTRAPVETPRELPVREAEDRPVAAR
jgi:hypothetical protein